MAKIGCTARGSLRHRVGVLGVAAVLLDVAVMAGCTTAAEPPDILLITIDTVRADVLGTYGGAAATPAIDALAAAGLLFERAVSPLPETRPAHTTIFTSQSPRAHGVVSNAQRFAGDVPTLVTALRDAGYLTAGFAGCRLFEAADGAALGFEHFDAPEQLYRPAQEVVTAALAWFEQSPPGQPRFLWVHLFDAHMPYEPPAPFNAPDEEPLRSWKDFHWQRLIDAARNRDRRVPAFVARRAERLYRGEVEYLDSWIGRLVEGIRGRSAAGNTLTALTADHGECFGEDGVFFDHSPCLGDGALRIPLLIHHPERIRAGRRAKDWAQLQDVAPTLLQLAGVEVPAEFAGRDLLASAAGAVPAYFESPWYREQDIAVRNARQTEFDRIGTVEVRQLDATRRLGAFEGDLKILISGEETQLFQVDALGSRPAVDPGASERLAAMLRQWSLEALEASEPVGIDEATARTLRALGYVR